MKKFSSALLVILVLLLSNKSTQATTHVVTVQNFAFSPASMTVTVGDTVKWTWLNGTHTTSSSTVPAGAATWSSPMSSGSQVFIYPVTVAGSYSYLCNVHPTSMLGSFTASVGSGIAPVLGSPFLIINSTLFSNELQITYRLEKGSSIALLLLDMDGKQLDNFTPAFHAPGTYTENFSVGNLSKGMYLLEFRTADMIASRKVVVE